MADFTLASFAAIAAALFVAELTDKDAFFLITMSTKFRGRFVFLAGATAFIFTSIVIVAAGSVLVTFAPVYWIKFAGGAVMIAYGLWEARGLVGTGAVEKEESRVEKARSAWRAFFAIVASLAILDLAGDATEVLIIVFVARYENALLVFLGACTGLLSATALEAGLGSQLGRFLTPHRLRYGSAAVFLLLGSIILLFNSG